MTYNAEIGQFWGYADHVFRPATEQFELKAYTRVTVSLRSYTVLQHSMPPTWRQQL